MALEGFDLPEAAEQRIALERIALLHEKGIARARLLLRDELMVLGMVNKALETRMPKQQVPDEQQDYKNVLRRGHQGQPGQSLGERGYESFWQMSARNKKD